MDCPRCRTPLDSHVASRLTLHGCPSCGGVWLDAEASHKVVEAIDPDVIAAADAEGQAARVRANVDAAAPCPVCQRALDRMPIEQARVVVDACREHGVWFDRDELQTVMRAVAPAPTQQPAAPAAAAAPSYDIPAAKFFSATNTAPAPIGGAGASAGAGAGAGAGAAAIPAAAFYTNDLSGNDAAPAQPQPTGWTPGKTALAVGGGVAAVAGVAYVATQTDFGREIVQKLEGHPNAQQYGNAQYGPPMQQQQQQQQPFWSQSPQQPGGLAALGSVLSKLF